MIDGRLQCAGACSMTTQYDSYLVCYEEGSVIEH